MDIGAIQAAIAAFLAGFAAKYPILVSVFMVIGIARAIFKPLFSFLHEFVLATPSSADDAFLDKVEKSKAYSIAVYLLDYLGSIKLVK